MLKVILYTFGWFFFSTCLSLYNKNLVGQSNLNFPYPLLTSAVHSVINFLLAALCYKVLFRSYFARYTKRISDSITPKIYLSRIVPCGIAGSLDIGLSNASMVFISLSFYTMCKSTVSLWAFAFAVMLGFEKLRFMQFLAMCIIVAGALLTYKGETTFDPVGFALVMTASISSGFRWALTQVLLQKRSLGINHPVTTLYYLSPVTAVSLLVISLLTEGENSIFVSALRREVVVESDVASAIVQQVDYSSRWTRIPAFDDEMLELLRFTAMMSFGGVLAFFMTLSEFMLIASTSVTSLCVIGISKEIVVILAAMLVYGDEMNETKMMGVGITIAGVLLYKFNKDSSEQEHAVDFDAGSTEKILAKNPPATPELPD